MATNLLLCKILFFFSFSPVDSAQMYTFQYLRRSRMKKLRAIVAILMEQLQIKYVLNPLNEIRG
jgi:hypothetical protein